MKFIFTAKDKEGQKKEGAIEASDESAAIGVLQKNGLFPISLKKEETDYFRKLFLKYYDSVKSEELVVFFRQLSIMIGAKVPIISALSSIREETKSQYLSRVLADLVSEIQDGTSFSDALQKHKDVFSVLSINIIRSGEASGNLKSSVEYVADNIEKNFLLSRKVKGALMYPSIIMIVFFIIGFLVISFVIPKLTQIIKEMKADVPWYTNLVIGVSDFMSKYWWAVGLGIIAFVFGLAYYLKTEEGKKEWDQIKLKIPIIGRIFRNVYITRFSENLAILLVGGIPIIRALTIVSSVIGNSVYEGIFLKAAEEVKIGGEMSDILKKYPEVPSIVTQMIKVGEESGQIDAVLGHVAKFYEQQTDNMTKNLATLIEPILMVTIGIAVGVMAFAILMPIYNIAGSIK